jgi:hypothetical protein
LVDAVIGVLSKVLRSARPLLRAAGDGTALLAAQSSSQYFDIRSKQLDMTEWGAFKV